MDVKLLMMKAITLGYMESHAEVPDHEKIHATLTKVSEKIKVPDNASDALKDKSAATELRLVLIWMLSRGFFKPFDRDDLLTRIRVATLDNDKLYNLYCKSIVEIEDKDKASQIAIDTYNEILSYLVTEEFSDILRGASRKINFERDKIKDLISFKDEIINKLDTLPLSSKENLLDGIKIIDVEDIDAVEHVFDVAQQSISTEMVLKYGLKALNTMTGEQCGARRGEYICAQAIPNQGKSGELLNHLLSFCIYNTPKLFDPSKKGLHIYCTIEDSMELVYQKLYIMLMQEEFGLPVMIKGTDKREMAEYITKRLTANGWAVRFVELPEGTHFSKYLDVLKHFQKEGFEIVSAGCDYVHLLGKDGLPVQATGDEVQLVHRKIRGFTRPNNIVHYTAHQLSTAAIELSRNYPKDYIRKLPEKGYTDGSKKLRTEFDFSYFIAKNVTDDGVWLEYAWDKHRKLGGTPENAKYFAVKFPPIDFVGINFDVNKDVDSSFSKIGSIANSGDWNSF